METRLTKLQIIDETVEYYSKNPRSVKREDGQSLACYYYHPITNAQCAFSRCTIKEFKDKLIDCNKYPLYYVIKKHEINVDTILQNKYKGHNEEFWTDIQNLHDSDSNWNELELTAVGAAQVNRLKDKYKD